ncbi:Aspartate 1-decarboxylase [Candidatus Gugararchaeum adminiculabundum]|nr:Aspartate 1-decarboxylase [Candidatus Gugararchaeum adminiculabundum]
MLMNMLRSLLKSKIHRATVTGGDVNYIGSITIDKKLMDLVDLWSGEEVLVVDNTNGERLVTYAIEGEENSGVIFMNGAAAHKIKKGDSITIIAFAQSETRIKSKVILVGKDNKFVNFLGE